MIKGLGALSPLPKPPPETSPMEVTFPPLPQPKLALDLATPEGCKAEFTWTLMAVRLLVLATRAATLSCVYFLLAVAIT